MDDAAIDALTADQTVDLARRAFKAALHKVAEELRQTFDDVAILHVVLESLLVSNGLSNVSVTSALHIASSVASAHLAEQFKNR